MGGADRGDGVALGEGDRFGLEQVGGAWDLEEVRKLGLVVLLSSLSSTLSQVSSSKTLFIILKLLIITDILPLHQTPCIRVQSHPMLSSQCPPSSNPTS